MNDLKLLFCGFQKGMKKFSHGITIIVNTLLLSLVYVIGVGITSLFAGLFGRHFLDMKLSKSRSTYWQDLNLKKKPIEEYYRQF